MADICPVCNKEIKAEDREEYKISSESNPIPIHNFCLDEFVSKPEGYFVKLREELAIEKEKDLVREKALERKKEDEAIDEKQTLTEINTTGSTSSNITNSKVQVTNFDMPFSNMVFFMVKWAIASIPALIILGIIVALIVALFIAILTALGLTIL